MPYLTFRARGGVSFFSPSDVWDISHYDQYWVYDYFNQTARICGKDERIEEEIGETDLPGMRYLAPKVREPSWD